MTFLDGSRVTPGASGCKCDSKEPRPDGKPRDCEFPCWQRVGMTDQPCCPGCRTKTRLKKAMR